MRCLPSQTSQDSIGWREVLQQTGFSQLLRVMAEQAASASGFVRVLQAIVCPLVVSPHLNMFYTSFSTLHSLMW